ncbi:MAG: sulfur carrier protein ThiS [Planctomycetota bacterium]|nr:sulfur carrier protein ThiS [Planctomycetota bacterium]
MNGTPREVPEGTTVQQLVELLGLGGQAVAAEVNKRLIPRKDRAQTPLAEGDSVELVSLVGGG